MDPDPPLAQQPVYVFRGHPSPVHALHFYRSNSRLISADAEGWVVVWDVPIRRPVAVWKAHDGPVLAAADWNDTNIVTHGRDHRIYVWQVRPEDEHGLDTRLPATSSSDHHRPPWMLHSLEVNALNFCAFARCPEEIALREANVSSGLLLAVPSSRDPNTIDIYQLPSQNRVHTSVGKELDFKTGMPMALKLLRLNSKLTLLVGYESGHVVVFNYDSQSGAWCSIYSSKPHNQPVLSLDNLIPSELPGSLVLYSSSADSTIARHQVHTDVPCRNSKEATSDPSQILNTRHAGQQSLTFRSDGKIFATAGWDSRIRVYAAQSMKEVAVLKWHKEGCYTVAFAQIFDGQEHESTESTSGSDKELVQMTSTITTINLGREERNRKAHILAAGSKDGRVSLWAIY